MRTRQPSQSQDALLEHFIGLGVFPFAMHVLVGLILVLVVPFEGALKWVWLAVLSAVLLAQAGVVHRYPRNRSPGKVRRSIFSFSALNFCIGLIWGLAAWLFLTPEDTATTLFFVFVTGGLIISSVATQHMLLRFCYLAMFPAYTMLVALMLVRGFTNGPEMSVLLVLFCVVMAQLAWRLQRLLLRKIELEAEKDLLVAELEKSLKHLKEAQADRARFLAQASHDLRQPVHAASLLTEAMARKSQGPLFGQLRAAIGNLVTMFDGLMDLSLFDGGKVEAVFEPVAVGQVLLDVGDSFALAAEEAGIEFRMVDTQATVLADTGLLKRIVVNLVSNVVRHAPGSSLLIGVRRRAEGLFLHVIDTGPGISEADRERVFKDFARLTPEDGNTVPGLGLGLSIVEGCATAMGASCRLRPGPKGGCDFSVGPFKLVTAGTTGPAFQPAKEAKGRVLVLDDSVNVTRAMGEVLTAWGYEADCHLTPDCLQPPITADALIIDNDLGPGASGFDLAMRLRETMTQPPPIIMMTGSLSSDLRDRARIEGIPVLSKPVEPAKLRSLLLQLLA